MNLDECVAEVIGALVGIDLQLVPEQDRYVSITRALNRALRAVAREQEWGYYSTVENVGTAMSGLSEINLRKSIRPRVINDDAVRLVDPLTKQVVEWAYFLPRDALHKNVHRTGLWVSFVGHDLFFSRPFYLAEQGLEIHCPVMREPKLWQLPLQPTDPNEELIPVPDSVREMEMDFEEPDLVIAKASYFYAQTDPVMQPRVQTLEANYKEILYSIQERDARNTDAPDQNDWSLGIESSVAGNTSSGRGRPLADERGFRGGW